MKITFILPPVNMSGGIRVVAIYADLLSKRGHDVTLISPPPKKRPLIERAISFFSIFGKQNNLIRSQSYLDKYKLDHRILERFRPPTDSDVPDGDVLIATWWKTAEWANELSESKGVKVYFIQGYEIFPHLPIERVKRTYQLPFQKIVVAKWLQRVMEEEYGGPVISCISNAVDHCEFYAEPRGMRHRPTVGFLYSPMPSKGLDIILRAIELLRKTYANLQVVSFGAYQPSKNVPLDSDIAFSYRPAQEELRSIYSHLDVWLTASRTEGFNLPAMEAMACRTPVVSTKTGWPEEAIVPGYNGFLVDIDDWKGLAEAAESILSSPNYRWEELSDNAFETASKYNWNDSAELLEASLFDACKRSSK